MTARIFPACVALLSLKLVGIGIATALTRQKRNVWLNAEDAKRFGGSVVELEHPDVARLLRAHRNDVENLVPFFGLGLVWLSSGGSELVGAVAFVVFTLARVLHTGFYLAKMGRARTACFGLGFAVIVGLALGLGWRAIAR